MTTTIIGYPRIGEHRELKFATQKYFKHQITAQELQEQVKALRFRLAIFPSSITPWMLPTC